MSEPREGRCVQHCHVILVRGIIAFIIALSEDDFVVAFPLAFVLSSSSSGLVGRTTSKPGSVCCVVTVVTVVSALSSSSLRADGPYE